MDSNPSLVADELSHRVAAVRLSLKWMGINRSLTAQQKEDLGATHSLDVRMITASRKILDQGHPVMRRMSALKSKIRKTWMEATLPYVESGIRLLPRPDLRFFHERMTRLKQSLQEASQDLEADYLLLRQDAKRRLGPLYDPEDYPESVAGLFDLQWSVMEVNPPQYLMRLDPELYRTEQDRVKEKFQEAVTLAEQAFLSEFSSLVEHLGERLSGSDNGEKKVFRDSAVDNLKAFIERFRRLNLSSHADLDRLVDQVQGMLSGVTPQLLRTRESWRQSISQRLGEVRGELDSLMVNRPRRRVLRIQEDSHAVAG